MRIVSNLFKDDIKISIFDYDLKYVIKFEFNRLEQTYKVDKFEYRNLSELEKKINSHFLENIKKRFHKMSIDLKLLN
tara:strand:+ start:1496 stop:1726 length:231 start_codon:yes stop_codon:yes gene_type:complete